MKLHSNPASPYGRKVKVVAFEKGLFDKIAVHTVATTAVGPDRSSSPCRITAPRLPSVMLANTGRKPMTPSTRRSLGT